MTGLNMRSKNVVLIGAASVLALILGLIYLSRPKATDENLHLGQNAEEELAEAVSRHSTKLKEELVNGLTIDGSVFLKKDKAWQREGTGRWASVRSIDIRKWHVELNLANNTNHMIILGSDVMLIEADGNEVNVNGSACFIDLPGSIEKDWGGTSIYFYSSGEQDLSWLSSYRIQSCKCMFKNGQGLFLGRMYMEILDHNPKVTEGVPATEGFGQVPPGLTYHFGQTLKQTTWIEEENRENLCLVLPKLKIIDAEVPEEFRLVLHLSRRPEGTDEWIVERRELIPLRFEHLSHLVQTEDAGSIKRILCANWLAEEYPNKCAKPLIATASSLQKGQLLATCLQILMRLRIEGLYHHAYAALKNRRLAATTRILAQRYIEFAGGWIFGVPIPEGFQFEQCCRHKGQSLWILKGKQQGRIQETVLVARVQANNPLAAIDICLEWVGRLGLGMPLGPAPENIKFGDMIVLQRGNDGLYEAISVSDFRPKVEYLIRLHSAGEIHDGVPMVKIKRFLEGGSVGDDITDVSHVTVLADLNELAYSRATSAVQAYLVVGGATTATKEHFQALARIVDGIEGAVSKEPVLKDFVD